VTRPADTIRAMGTVVLVHGAWHGAWCWDRVAARLDAMDVEHEAVELPLQGLAGDIATTRDAIVAAGDGAVVVGHSYGGLVISGASSGLATVRRLVYVAAFMTEASEATGPYMTGSDLLGAMHITEAGSVVDASRAAAVFYGDSDRETASAAVARLRPMTVEHEPVVPVEPGWKTIASTYVLCTADVALPPAGQRVMAARADEVVEWPTDHSPFLTRPRELAELVARCL
jgi:pimeloyl-ACP methyl ester carboxylesterase